MRTLKWHGSPGSIFSAEGVTMAPGDVVTVADEHAERLLAAHRSLNVPGEIEVGRLDVLREPGAPGTREDVMIARARAEGVTGAIEGKKLVHRGSGAFADKGA